MSEYDRGKYYGKKKFHATNEQSGNFGRSFFGNRPPQSSSYKDLTGESKPETPTKIKQPKLLIKTREPTDEASSISPSRKQKESDIPSNISINANASTPDSTTVPVTKLMKKSVKFLADCILMPENIQDYLQENNEFLVVGIVGAQGVGKSTILNLLAHNNVTDSLKRAVFKKFDSNKEELDCMQVITQNLSNAKIESDVDTDKKTKDGVKNEIFRIQTVEDVENNLNATQGIDFFITSNRLILLDCQPFMSVAVLDDLVQNENKRSSIVSEFIPLENSGEIHGLQLTAFLMSVCHILIVVQDWFFDSNVIRFIQTAEMLKPTNSNPEDDFSDHFPHLLLIQNKAQMVDFSPFKFKKIQRIYKKLFNKSKLHIESNLGLGSGKLITCLNTENCGNPINLFLIPEYDINSNYIYNGHPPLEEIVKKLRSNILGATKNPLTHIQLNEKTWLTYCSKVWDNVKKSSFFVEYTKLMP